MTHSHHHPSYLSTSQPTKPRYKTLSKALWLTGFLTYILLSISTPIITLVLIYHHDVFSLAKHCINTSNTNSINLKQSCEKTADMVTVFFACLVLLSLLIASISLLVLLRALFESVWGGCGWRGNRVGRGVRWFWGFGCQVHLDEAQARLGSDVLG